MFNWLLQGRDKKWTWHIVSHIIQGAVFGTMIASGDAVIMSCGAAWFVASLMYQMFGFWKKQDSVARDWQDYMIGMIPAMLITLYFVT